MPRKNRPNARTKARQMQAASLYLGGCTYQEVAQRLNYASESGARAAVQADLRRRAEGVDDKRLMLSARLEELIGSHWQAATTSRDAVAAGVVMRAMADLSRLWGCDAAARMSVSVGISEQEFAAAAKELLEATGVRPLVQAALPALPEGERAAWLRTVDAADEDDQDDDPEPWSNIGGPEYVLSAREPAGNHPPPICFWAAYGPFRAIRGHRGQRPGRRHRAGRDCRSRGRAAAAAAEACPSRPR